MQNVWLHFKACLNFTHTLVARIVSSFLPVFSPPSSPARDFSFPRLIFIRRRSDTPSWPFLHKLIHLTDWSHQQISWAPRCLTSHHIEGRLVSLWLAACGRGGGSVCLRLEIADMSDVSSTLRVSVPWAARVAEACTWPKWANPLHVSPRPVSEEAQGFPLKP